MVRKATFLVQRHQQTVRPAVWKETTLKYIIEQYSKIIREMVPSIKEKFIC